MNQEKNDPTPSKGKFFDQFCTTEKNLDASNDQPNSDITYAQTETTQPSIFQPDEITQPESGLLPIEAKHAIIALLKNGVIVAAQKNNIFTNICHYQNQIETYLANIYLKLNLDQPYGIAYITQMNEVAEDNNEIPFLINKRQLTIQDTLILLILRKYFQERETTGESKIIISIEHIEELLTPFIPITNHSKIDKKNLNAALRRLKERHILSNVRGSEDRYEITPIIRYVVNASFLESMLKEYKQLSEKAHTDKNATEREE